jgi:hypothetical protein
MTTTTRTEAVIVIPMLPPRECSPNYHGHWRRKSEEIQWFRQQSTWATRFSSNMDAFYDNHNPVTLDVEIAWCCGRKRMDDDNAKASLKAAIDGIADELWDGQDRHVTIGIVRQCRGDGTVTITLRSEA